MAATAATVKIHTPVKFLRPTRTVDKGLLKGFQTLTVSIPQFDGDDAEKSQLVF
jgi:hypothetical protein